MDQSVNGDEISYDFGVELAAGIFFQFRQHLIFCPSLFVRAPGTQGVVHVGYGHQASKERDFIAALAMGITAAIPALVVVEGDDAGSLIDLRFGIGKKLCPDDRVLFHSCIFFVGKRARLFEDSIGNADLAHVV